ncbi:uncharacterized protein LOC125668714 [Ostrea edulis]|uniref:uncharacterized protein LOC125668714 n=1 Tax=Ostrea edulis TaxID=37623 RepID=UPI0024AEE891|nr:uncharacterized protein LOC125668714 [Ostrea edulis]
MYYSTSNYNSLFCIFLGGILLKDKMLLIIRSCFLIFIATRCFAVRMSKGDLEEFDKNVRVDLAVVVTENFEKLTQQITSLNEDCMVKINATIDQCASCPRGTGKNSGVKKIVSVLSIPISEGEKLANTIVDSLSKGNVQKFLGEKLGPVVGTLKGTFSSLVNNKEIKDLTNFFVNFEKNLANLKSSLSNLPSFLEHNLNNLVGNIGSELSKLKFWRRKRSACLACEKLNSDDATVIITNVCGTGVAKSLSDLTKSIENLQLLYEDAINGTILTQIITGDPQMVMSPTLTVSGELQNVTYSIDTTTKTLTGKSGETIIFTDKPTSYTMLADKIYQDFV